MTFPLCFFIALGVISPWPIIFSIIFYYIYIFDTTFEYYITKTSELRRYWSVVVLLPIFCSYIFWLRYKRIGLSLDAYSLKETFLAILYYVNYDEKFLINVVIFLGVLLAFFGIRLILENSEGVIIFVGLEIQAFAYYACVNMADKNILGAMASCLFILGPSVLYGVTVQKYVNEMEKMLKNTFKP